MLRSNKGQGGVSGRQSQRVSKAPSHRELDSRDGAHHPSLPVCPFTSLQCHNQYFVAVCTVIFVTLGSALSSEPSLWLASPLLTLH